MAVKTIMVLDDDVDFLELMGDLLEEQGYNVRLDRFRTTEDALRAIQDEPPDLVILDLRVGDSNSGFELLQLLRQDSLTAQLPVILCTADALFLEGKKETLASLNIYPLEKPFEIDGLLLMVRRTLEVVGENI